LRGYRHWSSGVARKSYPHTRHNPLATRLFPLHQPDAHTPGKIAVNNTTTHAGNPTSIAAHLPEKVATLYRVL
jgi:hypothetical protein